MAENIIKINDGTKMASTIDEAAAIEQAVALIESGGCHPGLKNILFTLVSIIKSLTEANTQLRNRFNSVLNDSFTGKSTDIHDFKTTIINEVKDYLSKEHKNIYYSSSTADAEQLTSVIRNYLIKKAESHDILFDNMTLEQTITSVIIAIQGWDILDEFMNDTTGQVEEIQINEFNDISLISGGKLLRTDKDFKSPQALRLFVDRILLEAGKMQIGVPSLTEKNPFLRVRLGSSTRISIMGGGIARRAPGVADGEVIHVCIRKQKGTPITEDDLLKWGSLDEYGAFLIRKGIEHGISMLAFGGTGTGKTASFRALLDKYLPTDIRVITMAETDEMNLRKLDMNEFMLNEKGEPKEDEDGNLIKNPNYKRAVNSVLMWEFPDLTKEIMPGKAGFVGGVNASLTFTPDMIILQESKGGEIKDVIEEAVTGHQVATTIHVTQSKDVPLRILLMYQQAKVNLSEHLILKQVPTAFPWLIAFRRFRDGSRKVVEVSELLGFNLENLEAKIKPLYMYEIKSQKATPKEDGTLKYTMTGRHVPIFNPLIGSGRTLQIMRDNGLTDDEMKEMTSEYSKRMLPNDDLEKFVQMYGLSNSDVGL